MTDNVRHDKVLIKHLRSFIVTYLYVVNYYVIYVNTRGVAVVVVSIVYIFKVRAFIYSEVYIAYLI